jgi:Raf kinase inhibitor-like YbhB/YbcL family protein
MPLLRCAVVLILIAGSAYLGVAQTAPPGGNASPAAPGAQRGGNATPVAPGVQPGGRGRGGRGGIQVMTLSTTAWPDGGQIPPKHAQNGEEVSPPLTWSNVPDGTVSFVLMFHDLDAAIGNGLDDVLHWMLWNIPGATRSLPEKIAQGSQLPDGTRQISASGPYYRGPGALASGPMHHYVFELFALDSTVDVAAVGQSPPTTRAAVMAAMAGHIRGKAVYSGLFKRTAQ